MSIPKLRATRPRPSWRDGCGQATLAVSETTGRIGLSGFGCDGAGNLLRAVRSGGSVMRYSTTPLTGHLVATIHAVSGTST
jgi:hypothetical protein